MEVGISEVTLRLLSKAVADFTTGGKDARCDNQYALLFDEMAISLKDSKSTSGIEKRFLNLGEYNHLLSEKEKTQLTTHSLVFMLRHLKSRIIQPLGFYLTGSSVSTAALVTMIPGIVKRLLEHNINIRCVICDRGATNEAAMKKLGIKVHDDG
jgi:hypothetical protein